MKFIIASILILFLYGNCFGQDSTKTKYAFSDTTLFKIDLKDNFFPENLIKVEDNKNVIIYISEDSIRSIIKRRMVDVNSDAYFVKTYQKLLQKLDEIKRFKKGDLTHFTSSTLESIVSNQIISGKVAVYDKQNGIYLDSIFHRIERVISDGYRTFYFSKTNRRYLYSYAEWRGVIPNELMPDIE